MNSNDKTYTSDHDEAMSALCKGHGSGKVSAVGPFTPIVIATRSIVGEKKFNQIRGKGITLHSQVISEFCSYAGVPTCCWSRQPQ